MSGTALDWARRIVRQADTPDPADGFATPANTAMAREYLRYHAALEHLAAPSWNVPPTGMDARDMALYARAVLRGGDAT